MQVTATLTVASFTAPKKASQCTAMIAPGEQVVVPVVPVRRRAPSQRCHGHEAEHPHHGADVHELVGGRKDQAPGDP